MNGGIQVYIRPAHSADFLFSRSVTFILYIFIFYTCPYHHLGGPLIISWKHVDMKDFPYLSKEKSP